MDKNNNSKRVSGRATKRKSFADEAITNGKKSQGCPKTSCNACEITCCLNSNGYCAKSGQTSRWYHMSLSEHFCNNCFDNIYRPGKDGHLKFNKWANEWGAVATASKPTVKAFVANELLPYWIKCNQRRCGKWRKVCDTNAIDPKYIKKFECQMSISKSCDVVEDNDVALVLDSTFMSQVAEQPLLKNSPAAPYLERFLDEDIGICPGNLSESSTPHNPKFVEPFFMEQCGESSIWVKPGIMDEDETELAKRVHVSAPVYLGLRNLIVAVWNLTPSEWFTFEKLHPFLVCRGLVRIYLVTVAEQIAELLTNKAVINYGIIQNPALKLLSKAGEPKILVIGAGVSGLAAAAHLRNLGMNVSMFEAYSELGGRVKDVPTLGLGAFSVQGLLNNPFTILTIQAKAEFQIVNENYVVFQSNGQLIPNNILTQAKQYVDRVIGGALESDLEKVKGGGSGSMSFGEHLAYSRKRRVAKTPYLRNPDVFNNLLTLKGIKMQANLGHLSPLCWKDPIAVRGEEGFLPNGLRLLLIKLTRGIDIHYNHEVKSIDYAGDKVIVKTAQSEEIFSKVLVTVPLSVLQNDRIAFHPPLPDFKKKAIADLRPCYLEKLIMEFPNKFWSKSANAKPFSKFGILSPEKIFEVFVDVTSEKKNSTPTLVAYISERSPNYLANRVDKEAVDECMMVLKGAFGKNTPGPSKWFVTRWRELHLGGAFGSYLEAGSEMSAYDHMAATVDNKLYFAGEATFRNIPSTVTGAYLSGLREAAKIVKDLEL